MTEARPRVWVSQPLFDDVIERLREHFDVNAASEVTQYAPEQITAALRDADGALITLNEGIGATQIADAARLRAIANVGVGYNNLDIPALQAVGIVATCRLGACSPTNSSRSGGNPRARKARVAPCAAGRTISRGRRTTSSPNGGCNPPPPPRKPPPPPRRASPSASCTSLLKRRQRRDAV